MNSVHQSDTSYSIQGIADKIRAPIGINYYHHRKSSDFFSVKIEGIRPVVRN
jgi:hypothetical protein